MAWHREIEVAKWLVGHAHILSCAHGHHLLVCQGFGFFVFPLEDQLAHLRQVFLRLRMKHLIRLACPDGLLVKLDMFHGRNAEDHASDNAIAYGQRLRPGLGGLVVPEPVVNA